MESSEIKMHTISGEEFIRNGNSLETSGNNGTRQTNDTGDRVGQTVCKTYMSTPLFKAMRPLVVHLQIFGLFFPREYAEDLDECKHAERKALARKKARKLVSPWAVYSTVVLATQWINALRLFSSFNKDDSFGPLLFIKILIITWMFECALCATTCYYASLSYNCLPKYFLSWKELYQEGFPECTQYVRRKVLIYLIVVWVAGLVNIALAVYAIYFSNIADAALAPFSPNGPYANMTKTIILVLFVYLSMTWVLMQACAFLICGGLYKQLTGFSADFRLQIDKDGHFKGNLDGYRSRHQKLVRHLGYADNFVNIFVASSYGTGVVKFCLILYNLLWYDQVLEDTVILFMMLYWLTQVICSMAIASVGGALVNHAVSELPRT